MSDVNSNTKIRYFYDGLQVLCEKQIVDNFSESQMGFIKYEDGNNVSEWCIYDNDPPGSTISTYNDSERGNVVKLTPSGANSFLVGDNSLNANPNDDPWN